MLIILMLHFLLNFVVSCNSQDTSFTFNGFKSSNLISLDGIAAVTPNGLLTLSNNTQSQQGHAFYSNKINFKNNSPSVSSFSTSFVFAIVPEYTIMSAYGIAFVISPTRRIPGATSEEYLGLFNKTNNGNATNHVLAVELDTIQSNEFDDSNSNHIGIDINGLKSNLSHRAGYYLDSTGEFKELRLTSGDPMQVWVEYGGLEKQVNVTLAPLNIAKPKRPLMSLSYDLSPVLNQDMYVGFSSTSSSSFYAFHYVLGWSFKVNGMANGLDHSKLPKLPRVLPKVKSKFVTFGLPWILVFLVVLIILSIVCFIKRKRKFAEVLEDWEHEYGPHRFKYKDLYIATKGFKDNEVLGIGGFGRVYKGVLPSSNFEVAVKRVSHESRQGMREFVAEIVSIGRVRHRNIANLMGYCRRKSELLLVYDYMPNGSLDKLLYNNAKYILSWNQRFHIIKGVAAGLKYLHHEWEKVVIHRDVKASNVLLDSELNGRLGDFGLARLYDHGVDPESTRVVGTIGYLAPEHGRTGKATTSTDVYSFGAFLLEVACGKRPIITQAGPEDILLVDQVASCWNKGEICEAVDSNLGNNYVVEEVELVLKLGLLCSNPKPEARPSMQQVVQYLEGYIRLPELSSLGITASTFTQQHEGFDDLCNLYPSYMEKTFGYETSVAESILSGGR